MIAEKNSGIVSTEEMQQIIKGCQRGNAKCQKHLYMHCFTEMMKVCLRYHNNIDTAAATFNMAMLKVFNQISSFRNEGEFMGWVRRIIVNTCITELKKNAKFRYDELDTARSEPALEPKIYQHLEAKEILKVIQQLPEIHRVVFNLFVNDGYSHPQIAQELNIPEGTSKWYLHEARQQIRKNLKAIYNHEIHSNAI